MTTPLRFSSQIDGWLMAVLLVPAAACVYAIVFYASGQSTGRWLAMGMLLGLPGLVLPLWLLTGTSYELTDDELRVRCGPFRWCVPLREVRAVVPSRSLLSGPALSLDRLRIDYGRARLLLISPKDRQRFLSELQNRCATLASDRP